MPYESDAAATDEFSSVLAYVIAIIDKFNDHCFVLGGDFNVDFNKHKAHSRLLWAFAMTMTYGLQPFMAIAA
jgi:hypothetical protein